MINRVLIRLKVVQVMYAYYQNGGQNLAAARRELSESVNSAYSLYHTLLYLLVVLHQYSVRQIERKNRIKEHISQKEHLLAENRLLLQLSTNADLLSYINPEEMEWMREYVKALYGKIVSSNELEEYCQEDKFDYEADRQLCKRLYKSYIQDDVELDQLLEQENIYWNGDKELIDSFVLKTIRLFQEGKESEQPLLKAFKNDEDREFAMQLLEQSLAIEERCRAIISERCNRWDPTRLAFLDVLIIQTAVAEILGFPSIPLRVTINEYVELTKYLSTPKSGSFVNGILDTISKDLRQSGELKKS